MCEHVEKKEEKTISKHSTFFHPKKNFLTALFAVTIILQFKAIQFKHAVSYAHTSALHTFNDDKM